MLLLDGNIPALNQKTWVSKTYWNIFGRCLIYVAALLEIRKGSETPLRMVNTRLNISASFLGKYQTTNNNVWSDADVIWSTCCSSFHRPMILNIADKNDQKLIYFSFSWVTKFSLIIYTIIELGFWLSLKINWRCGIETLYGILDHFKFCV